VNPWTPVHFFIIRNTFLFTLPLFLFSVIINFENTKIFLLLHFTNQNTITISFTVYHCIAYYFSLHIPIEPSRYFLAPLHLHILLSVLYTYTPCVWQPLGEVEDTKQIYLLCRLFEEGQEGSLYTQFPESSIKTLKSPSWGNLRFHVLNTLLLESQPSESISQPTRI
jgi:hypothetical protein